MEQAAQLGGAAKGGLSKTAQPAPQFPILSGFPKPLSPHSGAT